MKREDLTGLGISAEHIDQIMTWNWADIEKQKNTITTLTTERDGLRNQLGEANKKLEGYDPEWKAKSQQAEKDAQAKIAEVQYQALASSAAAGYKFTSEAAKKAFLADLTAKKLPLQDDKLLGLEDFVAGYKKTDPGAFAESRPPVFSGRTPGADPSAAQTDKDKANAALREAFGRGVQQ